LKLQLWWMRSSTISRPLESNQMKCAFLCSLWRCPLPVSWVLRTPISPPPCFEGSGR
jgi:hypothetical protein